MTPNDPQTIGDKKDPQEIGPEAVAGVAAANGSSDKPHSASIAAPGSSTGPRPVPRLRLHPFESWLTRAATVAALILLAGYATGAYFTIQSLDSIARFAHDPDVENVLGDHLESIKSVHTLQQKLVEARLAPVAREWQQRPRVLSEDDVDQWLFQGEATAIAALDSVVKVPQEAELNDELRSQPVRWLDRNRLRLVNYIVEFPAARGYEEFKQAEEVRQRYQSLGANLNNNIIPTLVQANSIILAVSFLVLAGIFLLYTRRFGRRVEEMLEGFRTWSHVDSKFRFPNSWSGELRLIATQFNTMADEVEANRQKSLYLEKIASWQIIARKLAHEIKNPLTPIQMMVSQLKRRYPGSDPTFTKLLDDAQNIITEEVAGLRRMVDNFSNFARLPMPEPKPVVIRKLCEQIVALQAAAFEQHTVKLQAQADIDDEFKVELDPELIRQVLINLVKNAAEAAGEEHSTITIALSLTDEDLLIDIRDTGPGIPEDMQTRIFEAYFTTKHTGPSPGMGLGLAICLKIVMDHGGRLSVTSEPGDTRFTIRLPQQAQGYLR